MSPHRFFLVGPLGAGTSHGPDETVELPLSDEDRHHLRDVLRLVSGDDIVVVTPGGTGVRVRLAEVARDAIRGRVVERLPVGPEPRVTLVQGLPKGHKMDDIVSGAIEVGVAEIRPVLTERTVTRLDAEKRLERADRWARVAEAAAKQAQRSSVPGVSVPMELDRVLAGLQGLDGVFVLWEDATGPGLRAAIAAAGVDRESKVAVVVGPEGGLTAEEVRMLEGVGGVVCSLGPTVLRAETAGVIATALAIHELGGLGNDAEPGKGTGRAETRGNGPARGSGAAGGGGSQ